MQDRLTFDTATREATTSLYGYAPLRDPLANKGTAFTAAERKTFGLEGLLPARELTLDGQMARVNENYARATDDIGRSVGTSSCGRCRIETRRCSTRSFCPA